jgi:hypothetical protein
MATNRIIEHFDDLKILAAYSTSSLEQIRSVIKSAPETLLRCIQEISLNVLNSNVPLLPIEFNVLSKHKNFIRTIGKKKIARKTLKRLILSKPTVIPHLICPVLRAYKTTTFHKKSKQYDNKQT